MKAVRRHPGEVGLKLPIYDGSHPVEDMLSDPGSWRIYHELFRNLVRERSRELEEMPHWIPIELVFETLIIQDFMEQRGLHDIREGIGEFRAYQRRQMSRLQGAARLDEEMSPLLMSISRQY